MAAYSAERASDGSLARSGGSDYARLSRAVRQAGLMDRRTGNYAWRIAITVFLLIAGWVVPGFDSTTHSIASKPSRPSSR